MHSSDIPISLYDTEHVRKLEQQAIREDQLSDNPNDNPGLSLMILAGEACFRTVVSRWPTIKQVLILCGGGNNAGDGYVLARLLVESGRNVSVIQIGDASRLPKDAKICFESMCDAGVKPLSDLGALGDAELIVDAMFGIGLARPVEGAYAEAIEAINSSSTPVFSIDVPSGLEASTGKTLGPTVRADVTLTFIGMKQGLLTGVGPDYAGHVEFSDLNISESILKSVTATARALNLRQVRDALKPRSSSAHKGTNGHVLIIGGSPGYVGAVYLAGEAAARAGAGLVSVAMNSKVATAVNSQRPELMIHQVRDKESVANLLTKATVIAIGPGLGMSKEATSRFSQTLDCAKPLVVDADALRLLAAEPQKRHDWVLTPHPGEAAILIGCSVNDVQADRFQAAREIQSIYGGNVVLKGAGTIVVTESLDGSQESENLGIPEVVMHGNPGMGTGGMGDVLTGVIAGLIAQGISLSDAARLGSCIHSAAGDRAALSGQRGLLARDLMPHIRRLVN